MLNIFKTRRTLLAEIAELRVENGVMKEVYGAQMAEVADLKQQIADRETLLHAAYERLAKANGPKRNAKGQFVGKE